MMQMQGLGAVLAGLRELNRNMQNINQVGAGMKKPMNVWLQFQEQQLKSLKK